ncbi:cell division protein FtsB [Gilliamella apicola]|uniref:Cell division protein FtsB n=1 Tax=Gilliamella apicola TaxID=1196095 RepID=A0A556RL51_9GAMM|nr:MULTISPECIES: cell division protein FtsB [Gilliamella]OTQ73446.1 cell division protein FtsB [Gilliamella sp. N-G2]OTQ79574.1 cell division protein FtsB [Gilliamella sp. N-W3]TSJ89545.1 cell division protein FtsB [Gilliamella apicola]
MIRWKIPFLLLLVLGYLQYSLWYGKNNIYDYQENVQMLQNLHRENDMLKARNEQMFAEVDDLQKGYEAIEERARSHLGMVKPNEYFYRIIVDSNSQQ